MNGNFITQMKNLILILVGIINIKNRRMNKSELRKTINEEFKRIQRLAGIINENETPGNGPE